jgi:hypothetical protein
MRVRSHRPRTRPYSPELPSVPYAETAIVLERLLQRIQSFDHLKGVQFGENCKPLFRLPGCI